MHSWFVMLPCESSCRLLLCAAAACRTPEEFSRCLQHAMQHEPQPLSPTQLRKLTWEDATERFLQV
jgi:hypothetical protein